MANKVQRAQKNAKKEKGQFKKSSHYQTEYQRERDAAKRTKHRKQAVMVAE
ncbi:MAG: hypothetical protein IJ532_03875 [Alphaproteobacteria bacterium]|nr:hypothetical protein [Alphaproteobacteria bacterium]